MKKLNPEWDCLPFHRMFVMHIHRIININVTYDQPILNMTYYPIREYQFKSYIIYM